MELTKEDKIILAEWYNGEKVTFSPFIFIPESDSNQLDLLEDRMIKELGIDKVEIYYIKNQVDIFYFNKKKLWGSSTGNTENQARLSAILTHMQKIKLKEVMKNESEGI